VVTWMRAPAPYTRSRCGGPGPRALGGAGSQQEGCVGGVWGGQRVAHRMGVGAEVEEHMGYDVWRRIRARGIDWSDLTPSKELAAVSGGGDPARAAGTTPPSPPPRGKCLCLSPTLGAAANDDATRPLFFWERHTYSFGVFVAASS